ncbi:MAG: hypothetical protein AAF688_04360 [Bacteroidota bacterium]
MRTRIKYQVGSESLQIILIASLKAEASYENLMAKSRNQSLSYWLEYRKEATTDFIMKVLQQLENMGVTAASYPNISLKIQNFVSDLKVMLLGKNDESIISESLKIDERYLDSLYEVLKLPTITDELYRLYRNQIDVIRNSAKEFVQSNSVIF